MPRNADETQRKILDAATEEFARYGIAGARVDRITKNAGVNNALLYRYFGSKLELFDLVYSRQVTETVDHVPLDAADLPGYVGALYDYYTANPHLVRLAAWRQLERPDRPSPQVVHDATLIRIERIAAAQKAGILPNTMRPDELLALTVHLALTNTPLRPTEAEDTIDRERRRATVVEATRALLAASTPAAPCYSRSEPTPSSASSNSGSPASAESSARES
jgi:AcrR family transcriptional regulator